MWRFGCGCWAAYGRLTSVSCAGELGKAECPQNFGGKLPAPGAGKGGTVKIPR